MLTTGYSLFTDASQSVPGLTGSYVNQNLRGVNEMDWRATRTIAGTRVDPEIEFPGNGWGDRASVGLTAGSDADWEFFSAQWDGVVDIADAGTCLATRSDDGSRMWLDLDHDGTFSNTWPELVDNHWGSSQSPTTGPCSQTLEPGSYSIRIQYEEGFGGNTMQLVSSLEPQLRVAYVVPVNRMAQPGAEEALQDFIPRLQAFYAEQMARFGMGAKTFRYETEADGVTPLVHVVQVGVTDSYLREDIWQNTLSAATTAGIPIWSPRQVWLVIPEAHQQLPDGSVIGGTALGAGYGSGELGGTAMLGSDSLFRLTASSLIDDRPYAGQTVPAIGPYPLVQDVSFPWFEYSTFSSIASSIQGAVAHEVGHAFGLPHDFRNDENFRGTMMGNGLRGWRGFTHPDLYPSDDIRLSYAAALTLSVSAYFNPDRATRDGEITQLTVPTSGNVFAVNGLLQINFAASDADTLAVATLEHDGNTIGELRLSGTSVNTAFRTSHYEPDTAGSYAVNVYDVFGNRTRVATSVRVLPGANRAPQASINMLNSHVTVGQSITLEANASFDPDHPGESLLVEWDLNGDGQFDTTPTTERSFVLTSDQPGTRIVTARITDPAGAQSVAAPLAVRIDPLQVIHLSNGAPPTRLWQRAVQLEQGQAYLFSARIAGAYRPDPADRIAELTGGAPADVQYSELRFETVDGWTTVRQAITSNVARSYDLSLTFGGSAPVALRDLELRDADTGANLLRNGDLAAGLDHWEAQPGQIRLEAIDLHGAATLAPGQVVEYRQFDGQTVQLRAYAGRELVLLLPNDDQFPMDAAQIAKLVHRLDQSWDYYRRTTGHQPASTWQRVSWGGESHGMELPTVAVVGQRGDPGVALSGVAGIEIDRDEWEETYRRALQGLETRGGVESLMGQNFWSYDPHLESSQIPLYDLTAPFATIFGYQAGVAAGSTEEPGNELVDRAQSYRAAFDAYLAAPNWNLLRDGQGDATLGGLWLELSERFGADFPGRFFRATSALEDATDESSAVGNLIIAASQAAQSNLTSFFASELQFPAAPGLSSVVDARLAGGNASANIVADQFIVENRSLAESLDLVANDEAGPWNGVPSVILSVQGASQGGQLNIGLDGHRVGYAPRPGFFGVETFTYAAADAFGRVGEATVTIEVHKPWTNLWNAVDVDNSRIVAPLDALLVINALNANVPTALPTMPTGPLAELAFLDVSGDRFLSPIDALLVINVLNDPTYQRGPRLDDGFEPNNQPEQATELGAVMDTGQVVTLALELRDGVDWFRFTTSTRGTWRDVVSLAFQQASGDLDLILYDSSGRPLKSAQSIRDTESLSLDELEPGTYQLQVVSRGNRQLSYQLNFSPSTRWNHE